MRNEQEHKEAFTELEKAMSKHHDVEVKNCERLRKTHEQGHNIAICKVLTSIINNFRDKKIYAIVEAEILDAKLYANPEDIVVWIEDLGIFVLEIKSHKIQGIKSIENNVPQVIYQGRIESDSSIIDQPMNFAYKLRASLEPLLDKKGFAFPSLYFAAWLPNISPEELEKRNQKISYAKLWLSDMLERQAFLERLTECKDIMRGEGAKRETLEILVQDIFGCSSGLRPFKVIKPRSVSIGSLGFQIAARENQIKKLSREQEELIGHEQILNGPKVIRGVAGSGKTVVLANLVANKLLEHYDEKRLFQGDQIKILVLCFNKTLVPYLKNLIKQCFEQQKRNSTLFPERSLDVINIDKFAHNSARQAGFRLKLKGCNSEEENISSLVERGVHRCAYDHIFIDEGQDIDLIWFDWIKTLSKQYQSGPSILIFYDDAQNLYGQKRPGVGAVPPWNSFLGAAINARGARTIMRVGHRNTNEILTFSFNLLLGTFAPRDPEMAQFSDIAAYTKETLPDDPQLGHPNAGKPCIEKLDKRRYLINFAIHKGSFPEVFIDDSQEVLINKLIDKLKYDIDPSRGNIDPSHILIMTRYKNDVEIITKYLDSKGIKCHPVVDGTRDEYIFQEGKITVSTIHSAKGYTAHICHIMFVNKLNQPGQRDLSDEQRSRAMLHVGCTRAMSYLSLWGSNCPLMQEAQQARAAMETVGSM